MKRSTTIVAIAAVAIAAAGTAMVLFPRALPILALDQAMTRDVALTRADSFFRAHALAPAGARTAVRFQGNDSLRTFVELAGGGHDSLNALMRGRDVAPYFWSVRAFVPGDPREARVDFAPDGRIIGFQRKLAEADARPTVSADSGQRLAEHTLDAWISDRAERWTFVSSSYETRTSSGRIDRSYTFERSDRRIGGAPLRTEIVIGGDAPIRARPYVEIPETFRRRYGEMRSANELLSLIASLGILAVAIAGIVFLTRSTRAGAVRWREPSLVGAVIGVLALAAGLNEMPGSWFGYDTAMSPTAFTALIGAGAVLAGALTGVVASLTLAAAESATRLAFPRHLDWWKLWTYRGTREVAAGVGGGYAAACIAFAYVAIFYLVTRTLFGWWVPSALLDDPNQIASPMPWISGIAISLNAGVWEEALFRALPLALLSLWIGQRANRRAWMVAGVVVSSLIFGFAHSDYASWPPYSRGVEIFLDACFWAVLFLQFGLLVTVVAHFAYDLVLFGLFAASGSATEYRVSAAIIALALLAPAMAVAWKWVQQRGFTTAPEDARFSAWTPVVELEEAAPVVEHHARVLSPRGRQLAIAAIIVGVLVAVGRPTRPTLGPPFTVDRERAVSTADSLLRAHGGDPSGWMRLAETANDTLAQWPRFVREHKIATRMQEIATTYHPPAWWVVRYVRTGGTAAERTEEWRIRVWPDGRPLDARHIIPDSARRTVVDASEARRIALAALARDGVETSTLQESEFKETARPSRRDVTVTYTDTAMTLPAGARARAWVQIAGDEPLLARRGIELPEAFLRADRERQTNRMMIAGLCALLLLGGIATGLLVVLRRPPLLVDDGLLDRRRTLVLLGVLTALGMLERLNALPSEIFSYDTSEPFNRFLGTIALGYAGAIPSSLFVLGVWLLLGAVRRRVGIPMRAAQKDLLVAGLGLGALVSATSGIGALVARRGMPSRPSTLLDLAFPVLDHVAGIPAAAMVSVAIVGIPILVIAGLSPRWSVRALYAAVAIALVVAAGVALAPQGDRDPVRALVAVAMLPLLGAAFYWWGAVGAWSWIIAALGHEALSGLRGALYAPTSQEQIAGVVTVAVVVGAIVILSAAKDLHFPLARLSS